VREKVTLRLGLNDSSGRLIHDASKEVEVFPAFNKGKNGGVPAAIVGAMNGRAWNLAQALGLAPHLFSPLRERARLAFVDDTDAFEVVGSAVRGFAELGGTAVFLEQPAGALWHLGDHDVKIREMTGREFVSRKTGHPLVAAFEPFDFSYWYDAEKDYIEYVATCYLEGRDLLPILQTFDREGEGDAKPLRVIRPVAAELRVGRGSCVVSQLKATARASYQPLAAAYYQGMIDRAQKS
jgi:hypothetical protein